MKTRFAVVLAALFVAAPYASALEEFKIDFAPKLELAKFQSAAQDRDQRLRALQTALIAMNDGNEIGTQIVDFIKSADVRIEFRKQAAPSSLVLEKGAKPLVCLSEDLPLYPRVLAVYVARETSKLMLDAMVDSAEKEYMKLSLTLRAWLELGGSAKRLPVIEPLNGYADKDLAADFSLWLQDPGSETALDRVGRKTKTEIIPVLQDQVAAEIRKRQPGDPTRRMLEKLQAGLEEDNRRFVTFLLAEHEWRKGNDSWRVK